jgi:prepilin-type N-terminal cleavage/methylation domain-containing protein
VRGPRGFTLVEVMVALMVFAIGALALAAVVPLGTRKVTQAGRQSRASQLAAQGAEELLGTPYGDPLLGSGTHDDAANPHEGTYFVRWVVEDGQPIPACKRITITVRRNSVLGPPEAMLVVVSPESGG